MPRGLALWFSQLLTSGEQCERHHRAHGRSSGGHLPRGTRRLLPCLSGCFRPLGKRAGSNDASGWGRSALGCRSKIPPANLCGWQLAGTRRSLCGAIPQACAGLVLRLSGSFRRLVKCAGGTDARSVPGRFLVSLGHTSGTLVRMAPQGGPRSRSGPARRVPAVRSARADAAAALPFVPSRADRINHQAGAGPPWKIAGMHGRAPVLRRWGTVSSSCSAASPAPSRLSRRCPYSIPGTTRSGGRWPSAKVRMFRITFSPISMRPSTVALPIWGGSTTLGRLRRRGLASCPCS